MRTLWQKALTWAKIEISSIVTDSGRLADVMAAISAGKEIRILDTPELICSSCKLSIPTTAAANNDDVVVCARCRENKHLGDVLAGVRRERDDARAGKRAAIDEATAARRMSSEFAILAHGVLDRRGGAVPNLPTDSEALDILRGEMSACRDLRHRVDTAERAAREAASAVTYIEALARHLAVSLDGTTRDPATMLAAVCNAVGALESAPAPVRAGAWEFSANWEHRDRDRGAFAYDVKAEYPAPDTDPRQLTIDDVAISPAPPPTGERSTAGAEMPSPSHVPPASEDAAPAVQGVKPRDYLCGKCGAPPGTACRRPTGKSGGDHDDRKQQAARASG